MEVVGVVAAVPPLLKMLKQIGTGLSQISSKTRTSKVAQGLRSQLNLLTDLLASVETRRETWNTLGSHSESRLASVIRDLRTELTGLLDVVDKVEGTKGGGPSVFRRVQLVLTGFEKDLKERGQRLDCLINVLQISLAELETQSRQRLQIRKLLAPLNTDFISKKLDGTLEWIWFHDKFKGWLGQTPCPAAPVVSDIQSRVFIIHGVKGCGKSVLAASVVEELKAKGSTTLFFSFWAGHGRERTCDAMLRALLWQLLETLPAETQFRFIPGLLESRGELRQTMFLSDRLGEIGQEVTSKVFCIVDGIDESTDDWNSPDKNGPLGCLSKLLETIPTLRLLLIGRQSSLRSAIAKWPSRIELTKDLVLGDLSKFITAELDNCPNITDDETRNTIRKELDAKSTVMFLWIKLVFQELRSSFSPQEVAYTLGRIPEELDREYCRLFLMLMARLHGRPSNPSAGMIRSRGLLELIVGASRPLTGIELRLAYAFASLPDASSTGYMSSLVSEEGIIDACGDFISIKDDAVSLGHTSMREFLLRPVDRWTGQDDGIVYFRLESKRCHRVIGLACLKYLKHVDWQQGDSDYAQWADDLAKRYPLLCYASNFTTAHLLDSDLSPDEVSIYAREFIESGKLATWVEFAVFAVEGSSLFAPPPPNFWEETIQFWGAHHLYDLGINGLEKLVDVIAPGMGPRILALGLDPGGTAYDDKRVAEPGSVKSPLQENTVNKPIQNTVPDQKTLQLALQRMMANNQVSWSGQLLRNLPGVSALIRRADILLDPLDALFRSFERAIDTASYPTLVMFATMAELHQRHELASKFYKKALATVEGKNDIREAWALGRVADFGDDSEVRQAQYAKVMELLESRRGNPLAELARASTSSIRARCLFDLGRSDEAKQAAAEAQQVLLNPPKAANPSSPAGALRQWCYQQMADSKAFSRLRMEVVLNTGTMYDEEGLGEETDRLLSPFAQMAVKGGLPRKTTMALMEMSLNAKHLVGHLDEEALSIALHIKRFMGRETKAEKVRFCCVQLKIVRIYTVLDRYEDAAEELASMDVALFLSEAIATPDSNWLLENLIFYLLHTYAALERLEEAVEILEMHWPIVEKGFAEDRVPSNCHIFRAINSMIGYGLFHMSEQYLRQMLRPERLSKSGGKVEEFYLREGLAFSIYHQSGNQRFLESHELYQECAESLSAIPGGLRDGRLLIGLGCTAASMGKPLEAASHFKEFLESMGPTCDHDCALCIPVLLSAFFKAMVELKQGQPAKALSELELFPLVETILDTDDVCVQFNTLYDDLILIFMGQMLRAQLLASAGKLSEARETRSKILALVEELLDKTSNRPAMSQLSLVRLLVRRWARACRDYLSAPIEGDDGGTDLRFPLYPFELLVPIQENADDDDAPDRPSFIFSMI